MKKTISFLIFGLVLCYGYATEQLPDRLIIKNDTFYLKTFPLEKLEFEKSPFSYGEFNFPHTGCWRGYCATWEIIDNRLVLIEVEKVDSTHHKLNIADFFKQNDYSPQVVNGYVFADWFTSKLLMYSAPNSYKSAGFFLVEEYDWTEKKEHAQLVLENGILKENNILEFDAYKTGDRLSIDFSHFPPGLVQKKSVRLKASIIELRKPMAVVTIDSYDTKKEEEIEQIRKYFANMVDTDTVVTNPRYWTKH